MPYRQIYEAFQAVELLSLVERPGEFQGFKGGAATIDRPENRPYSGAER